MSIKRNKKVTIKLAISQEELDEIGSNIQKSISGNIEDIEQLYEFNINGVNVSRILYISECRLYKMDVSIVNEFDDRLELEELIISIFTDNVIDAYNQSIEQEKQIRQDQRDGY